VHTHTSYLTTQSKYADYPGLLPYTKSRALFDADLDMEQRSVRGTLIQGLSQADIDFLDVFEGNVLVHTICVIFLD
jgi:hypothetical protein